MSGGVRRPVLDSAAPGAAATLDLFDEGLLQLDPEGRVVAANAAACSLLGLDRDNLTERRVGTLLPDNSGWAGFVTGADGADRTDLALRLRGGRSLLATRRSRSGVGVPELVLLRDLDALRHRHDRAAGIDRRATVRFLSGNRTRPDFAAQRRLSPDLNRVLSRGERAIREGMRVLVTGESGVGKSEVARFLHGAVADARDPFIVVNCASSSEVRFEAELFGREAGSEGEARPGLLEQAEGGTLFLDEVAEIPLGAQAKLLGFLEDGLAIRPGGAQGRLANIRVIAATNRDLRQMVREGRFRADLYFRLAVIVLAVPPLRDMPALIGHLADRFLQTLNQRRTTPMILPQRYRDLLEDYSFPGNIRELLNIVQRTVVFVDDAESIEAIFADLLAPMDIPGVGGDAMPAGAIFDLRAEVRRYEAALIDKAIRVHGSKRKAAKALGVNIGTIVRKTAADPETTTDQRNQQGST